MDRGLEEMLDALQLRLTCGAFPHEIGLFLGYPPEDVEGFRLHRGRDYKLCGCWKVYSDVEGARQCFRRYDRCRAALCRRGPCRRCFEPPDRAVGRCPQAE